MEDAQTPQAPQAPAPAAPAKKQRANSAYVFAVRDGKMVWDYGTLGVLVLDPDKVNAVKRHKALMYGLKQIVNDGAALDADASGKVDPKAKFLEAQGRIERLEDPLRDDWKVRPGETAATGPASYVTQALVKLGTYQGQDVGDATKANAFVERVAKAPALKLGGEMGKARKWLEANSRQIRDAIAEIRAAEAPVFDADVELAALFAPPEAPQAEPPTEGEAPNEAGPLA